MPAPITTWHVAGPYTVHTELEIQLQTIQNIGGIIFSIVWCPRDVSYWDPLSSDVGWCIVYTTKN